MTDAQGNFALKDTPAGRFFVHIDGRTVVDATAGIHYPDKAYYPFVGGKHGNALQPNSVRRTLVKRVCPGARLDCAYPVG